MNANTNLDIDFAELAERYVALWNLTDAGARRDAIASLWAPQGEHCVRTLRAKGYEALVQRVTSSHEKNVRDGGFLFRAAGDAQLLENTVMFHWEMVPAAGGNVAALGLEFLVLAEDGRIAADYQFILPMPSA
jgi:cell division FtsZ-interacting protein ZapD